MAADAADLRAAWALAGQAGRCREELRPWPGAWRVLSRGQLCRHCCRLYRILLLAPSLGSGHTGVLHPCRVSLLPHHCFQGSCGLKRPLACVPQAPRPSSTPPGPRSLPDATAWRNAPFLELPHPSPCNLVLPRHSCSPSAGILETCDLLCLPHHSQAPSEQTSGLVSFSLSPEPRDQVRFWSQREGLRISSMWSLASHAVLGHLLHLSEPPFPLL